jgi:Holliday junction resolvase
MGINIRAKGQNGERELQTVLESIVREQYAILGRVLPDKPIVQRNQNQSAVGGCDLVGTFGLAIEVKRQEALSINTWWQQTVISAQETGGIPVLLYRQNGKKWKCVVNAHLPLPLFDEYQVAGVRCEIDFESFKQWFALHVRNSLLMGI